MKGPIHTFSVFYRFLLRKKYVFGLFLLVTISSSAAGATIPYFFKLLVDSLQSFDYQKLLWLLILLMVVRFFSLLTTMLSYFLGDVVTLDAVTNARQTIFKHVQDLDFAFHSEKSTGSLISAFKRGDGSFWSINHDIHHRFLDIVVKFIVMVYFLSKIDIRISGVVFVSFAIAALATYFLVKFNIKKRALHNDEEDNVSAIIVDNMVNFETVKLFSKEVWELDRLKKAFIPWLETGWEYVNTFRLIDFTIGTIINISIFLIIYLSLNFSRSISLSVGDFVLVLGFISSFYPQLWELVYGFRDIGKNYADVKKYFNLLDYKVEVKDPAKPVFLRKVNGEIKFQNVSFAYDHGKKNAVKNIELDIRQGQKIAFVGRSGSGKTTLVKLLMRFYDINSGKITIDGRDIKSMTKAHLRSFMGIVPQEPVLFNNTIRYNIAYGKSNASQKEIEAAAKIANLHKFIKSLTKGYETHVGERGIKLSGGQKQRLAIARMVLSDPQIIIFDEATSQLDSENEKLIQEALGRVTNNKTTIIIAHRLSTASRADKIVVMDKGRVVEEGSHQALIASSGSLYKHFWDLQINV